MLRDEYTLPTYKRLIFAWQEYAYYTRTAYSADLHDILSLDNFEVRDGYKTYRKMKLNLC